MQSSNPNAPIVPVPSLSSSSLLSSSTTTPTPTPTTPLSKLDEKRRALHEKRHALGAQIASTVNKSSSLSPNKEDSFSTTEGSTIFSTTTTTNTTVNAEQVQEWKQKATTLQAELEASVLAQSNLTFQWTESQRVAKFLESKLTRVLQEAQEESDAQALEAQAQYQVIQQLEQTNQALQDQLQQLLAQQSSLGDVDETQEQQDVNKDDEFDEAVSVHMEQEQDNVVARPSSPCVARFLEKTPLSPKESQSEESNEAEKQQLQQRVQSVQMENDTLRYQVTEAQRITKFLETKLLSEQAAHGRVVSELKQELQALQQEQEQQQLQAVVVETVTSTTTSSTNTADVATMTEVGNGNKDVNADQEQQDKDTLIQSLTAQLAELEAHVKKLEQENDDLKFCFSEAHRVSQLMEQRLKRVLLERKQEQEDRAAAAATSSSASEDGSSSVDAEALAKAEAKFEKKIATLRNQIQQKDKLVAAFQEQNCELGESVNEAKEEAEAAQEALEKEQQQTSLIRTTCSTLRKKLQEKDEEITELKEENQYLTDTIDQLKTEATENEEACNHKLDGLKEAQSVAKFLEGQMHPLVASLQAEKAVTADLQFQLTEARRVTTLLESKLLKVVSSPDQQEAETGKSESRDVLMDTPPNTAAADNDEMAKLVARNQELESQITELKKDTNQSVGNDTVVADLQFRLTETQRVSKFLEAKLNKLLQEKEAASQSKDSTVADLEYRLTESQRVAKFLEGKLQTVLNEKNRQEKQIVDGQAALSDAQFKVSESQRVIKFLEDKLNKIFEEKASMNAHHDGVVADLQFRLADAQRVSKFLESKLTKLVEKTNNDKSVDGSTEFEAKIAELQQALSEAKEDANSNEAALNKSYNTTLDGLTNHIESLDKHIKELEDENERLRLAVNFLEQKINETDIDDDGNNNTPPVGEPSGEMSRETERSVDVVDEEPTRVEDQPQDKDSEIKNLEERVQELEATVQHLKNDAKSTEATLNKSYNDTLEALTGHISTLEEQVRELDTENDDLRFKLSEAQRVCQYMQNKLTESKSRSLSDAETQFKLLETQRVSKFLETKSQSIIEEKNAFMARVAKLENDKAELEYGLTESQRICKYLEDKITRDASKKETDASTPQILDAMQNNDASLADARFKMTEAQRVSKFLEAKLTKVLDENREMAARISELDFEIKALKEQLAEAPRVSTFLGKKMNKVITEKQAALLEVETLRTSPPTEEDENAEGRLSSLEEALQAKEAVIDTLQSEKDELMSKVTELEEQLQDRTLYESTKKTISVLLEKEKSLEKQLIATKAQLQQKDNLVAVMQAQNCDLGACVNQFQQEAQFTKNAFDKLKQETQFAKMTLSGVTSQLHEKEDEIAELKEENQDLNVSIYQFKKEARATEATLSELNEQLQAKEDTIVALEEENRELRKSTDQSVREIQVAETDTLERLTVQVKKNETRIGELEREKLELANAAAEAQQSRRTLESDLDEVVEEKEQAVEELRILEEKLSKLERVKEEFKNKAYDVGVRMATVNRELQKKEKAAAEYEAAVKELEDKVTILKQEVTENENNLNKSYNDTLDSLTTHVKEAEKQIDELQQENNKLSTKLAQAEKISRELQAKTDASVQDHQTKLSDYEFKIMEAQRVSKFLETKVQKAADEKEAAEQIVEKFKCDIAKMETIIADQAKAIKEKEAGLEDAVRNAGVTTGRNLLVASSESLSRNKAQEDPQETSETLIKTLKECLSMARISQEVSSQRVTKLVSQLDEKEKEVEHFRTQWESATKKAGDMEAEITQLKEENQKTQEQVVALLQSSQRLQQQQQQVNASSMPRTNIVKPIHSVKPAISKQLAAMAIKIEPYHFV